MDFEDNKVFAYGTKEEKEIKFFEICNGFEEMDCDLRFSTIMNLRPYIFSSECNSVKMKYIDLLLSDIKVNKYSDAYLELLGVLYKYFDKEIRKKIDICVLDIIWNNIHSTSGIVATTNYIKSAWRMMDNQVKEELLSILKDNRNNKDKHLNDTYEYLFRCLDQSFISDKKSDILLIIPEFLSGTSFLQPPLGAYISKNNLERSGIFCDLLDNRVYNYSLTQLQEIANNYRIIIVISSPIDQVQNYFVDYRYNIFCKTVNSIKHSNAFVIVCGAHGTVRSDLVFQDTKCDLIIQGEFEFQILETIQAYLSGTLEKARNVIIRKDNSFVITESDNSSKHPKSWEDSVVPYNIIETNDYFGYNYWGNIHIRKMNYSIVQASRGCPFRCSFCYDFYEKKLRYKKLNCLLEELIMLHVQGITELFFIDQTFGQNKQYYMDICNLIISHEFSFQWSCETRVDVLDEDLIIKMKQAGCTQVWLGIESMDDNVIKQNNKGYQRKDMLNTIDLLDKYNIDYCAFIMMGMVGETLDSLDNTVNDIIRNKIRLTRSIITFTPRFSTDIFATTDGLFNCKHLGFNDLYYLKGSVDNQITFQQLSEHVNKLVEYVRAE